jgi:hypothetical protein
MNSVGIFVPSILLVVIGALLSSVVGSNVHGANDPFQKSKYCDRIKARKRIRRI